MYAKSSPGCVYHLLTADWEKTLCGLKIVAIVIDRKAKHVLLRHPISCPRASCVRIATGSSEKKVKRRNNNRCHRVTSSALEPTRPQRIPPIETLMRLMNHLWLASSTSYQVGSSSTGRLMSAARSIV